MTDAGSNRPVIAGIGEILWDVIGASEKLGGAPVNFAYHAGQLGAEAYAIASVGADSRGEVALQILKGSGITTAHITDIEGVPTGYVTADVDADGVATYDFPDNVAWDQIRIESQTMALAAKLDGICFGSLAQRSQVSRQAIHHYLNSVKPAALKIFDLNIRQNFYSKAIIRDSLKLADILKLNDDEIKILAELESLDGDTDQQLRQLLDQYDLTLIVLTRGVAGSLLVAKESVSDHPGFKIKIVDTIGAGDSFTAVTAVGLLNGYSLETINAHANRVAAFVCSQKGAMVSLPAELRQFYKTV